MTTHPLVSLSVDLSIFSSDFGYRPNVRVCHYQNVSLCHFFSAFSSVGRLESEAVIIFQVGNPNIFTLSFPYRFRVSTRRFSVACWRSTCTAFRRPIRAPHPRRPTWRLCATLSPTRRRSSSGMWVRMRWMGSSTPSCHSSGPTSSSSAKRPSKLFCSCSNSIGWVSAILVAPKSPFWSPSNRSSPKWFRRKDEIYSKPECRYEIP